ncbi:MAG: hypothetical protein LCH63_18195 [Candidatus Melainabacteria bacterium]|nr:hypothetical protein [Candidatus Melainabacteria bacterium]
MAKFSTREKNKAGTNAPATLPAKAEQSKASSEVSELKAILQEASKRARSTSQTGKGTAGEPTVIEFQGNRPFVATINGELVTSIRFQSGRLIELTAAQGKNTVYKDSQSESVRLTQLTLDLNDGSISYKRQMGKGTARIIETLNGAKYATLSLGKEKREIELSSDRRRIFKGKEGTMTVSPDGSLVSLRPNAGGSIDVYPWVKLVSVEFPDGHKQTFYASDSEVSMLRKNPVGFYVNWLPTDKQGHHFEWGTLELG